MKLPDHIQRSPNGQEETLRIHGDPAETSALVRLLDHYLAELQAGRTPDRAKLLAEHPHLAAQLEPALAGLEMIHSSQALPAQIPVRMGDFRIIREVGRGGMGIVYEAEQISLKRRVALKVLRYGAVVDVQAMQRFQREAQTVAVLHHTNIVPIFAIGSEDGTPYYAMQFIEGRSLAQIASESALSGQALPAAQVADWGLQAAEALAHAHARGVIHRDIKPSNLILDPDGRIWLTDFGLAKRAEDVTLSLTGALLGTPRYMSPEQASSLDRAVDHRTDIYSLGATLYELAANRPIFPATSPDKIINQILTADPAPPRRHNPSLPKDLETIIMKCLSKDPQRRYASAQDLAYDLRALRENRPIKARRPAFPERAVRWARKHQRTLAIASGSAATATALVLVAFFALQHHRTARLGGLALTTGGTRLLAEVLHPDGRPALPSFPVPTDTPISLPEGQYQLRLSASGLLSQSWPVEVERHETLTFPVSLQPRYLWPAVDLPSQSYPESASIVTSNGSYIAILLHPTSGGHRQDRLRLIDGATGQPVWKQDLIFSKETAPPDKPVQDWVQLMLPAPTVGHQTDNRLMLPAPDLNGDGMPELVWFGRTRPSLLAVSGADGQVLWWHRSHSRAPRELIPPGAKVGHSNPGAMVGYPATVDIDADGVLDVVAAFTSMGDNLDLPSGKTLRTPAASWISAVSGRDGALLWQRDVEDVWKHYSGSSDSTERYNALVRLALDHAQTPPHLVFAHEGKLLRWNVATGEDAHVPLPLSFEPSLAPFLNDLGSEATALFVKGGDGYGQPAALHAVRLADGTNLWSAQFILPIQTDAKREIQRWIRLVDLDRDGQKEIALSRGSSPGPAERFVELILLSGATGRTQWRSRLPAARETPVRIVEGPDLDKNGTNELFVAWLASGSGAEGPLVKAAAFSGTDGRALWTWQHPHSGRMVHPDPSGPLLWWELGPDGWPLLGVPVIYAHGGQHATYFLSASEGQLIHILPEVADPQAADLDQDGLADLYHLESANRLVALQGLPPSRWSRLGTWSATEDLNRDGYTDLISPKGQVRSGKNQALLFELPEDLATRDEVLSPPLPQADLNNDGVPDLIRWESQNRKGGGAFTTVAARSGRDASLLWRAVDFKLGSTSGSTSSSLWSSEYPRFYWTDLDQDNRADVLVHHGDQSGTKLAAINGADGRLLWSLPVARGAYLPLPSPVDQPFADLNGDRVLDPVLWVPSRPGASDQPVQLGAFDGRNGRPLWLSKTVSAPAENRVIWPQPLARDIDGDDIPDIIATTSSDYLREPGGYHCELAVADGRSGQLRWTWSWRAGFPNILPPIVARFAGDQAPALCLGLSGMNGSRLLTFGPDGKITRELPLARTGGDLPAVARYLWRSASLDEDPGDELLFLDGDQLCAWNGTRILWTWTVDLDASAVIEASSSALILWSGKTVFGLEPASGQARWRCEVPDSPRHYGSPPGTVARLAAADSPALPRVLLQWTDNSSYTEATVCRQAWPTFPDGRYRVP